MQPSRRSISKEIKQKYTTIPDTKPLQFSNTNAIHFLSIMKSGFIPLITLSSPILIFATVKMLRARMCEFLRLSENRYAHIEKLNRFLSAGGRVVVVSTSQVLNRNLARGTQNIQEILCHEVVISELYDESN